MALVTDIEYVERNVRGAHGQTACSYCVFQSGGKT